MKNVVILGGGFAGIRVGLELIKANLKDTEITLVDKDNFQTFHPSLYEVATSEEPMKNVAIPYSEIFGNKINLIQANVEKIDSTKQIVQIKLNLEPQAEMGIKYDYLIIALGSEPSFMNIEGLEKYSMPLKTLEDAVKIRDQIKSTCCEEGKCNKKTKVIIGGGSFSGTELAGELLMYKDKLATQNHLDPNCLDISILQRSNHLLSELDPKVSEVAEKRVSGPNVHYLFGGHIKKVTKDKVFTDTGNAFDYDILIWTGGVAANHIASVSNLPVNNHGQIIVNDYLQVEDLSNIFAAGDIAAFIDKMTQKSPPGVAEVAEDMGKIVGENIINLVLNKPLKKYKIIHLGYIVPLKGRFAVAQILDKIQISGFLAWVMQQLVVFWYFLNILPIYKAFKKWNKFEIELKQ